MKKHEIKIIGRTEYLDFLEWGILGVRAKIDTGAYTSALHCRSIKLKNGILTFVIAHSHSESYLEKKLTTGDFKTKNIISSNGLSETRYIIRTKIRLGEKKITTEFSLTDRSKLKNPVLIGRKLLKKRFLVDVSSKFVFSDLSKNP